MQRQKMKKAGEIFVLYRTFFFFMLAAFLLFIDLRAFAENSFVEKGKGLFESKCSPCHTIGGGKKVGPDLKGINEKMPREWLLDFISDPEKMFSSNDPAAVGLLNEYKMKMPNPGLSRDDVSAILDFLGSPKDALQPPAPKKEVISMGDASLGKKLFVGLTGFKNGGAPCSACHSVTGIGFLGGGNLGPDLTRIYPTFGDGLASVLTNIPFPTMIPVFKGHPLTLEEALNVAAFLKEKSSSQPQDLTQTVVIIAIIGFLVLMILIGFVWRHRLVSVRAEMVESYRDSGKARRLNGLDKRHI